VNEDRQANSIRKNAKSTKDCIYQEEIPDISIREQYLMQLALVKLLARLLTITFFFSHLYCLAL